MKLMTVAWGRGKRGGGGSCGIGDAIGIVVCGGDVDREIVGRRKREGTRSSGCNGSRGTLRSWRKRTVVKG